MPIMDKYSKYFELEGREKELEDIDERLKVARDIAKQARQMELAGMIGGTFSDLPILGKQVYKSKLPEFFRTKREHAARDVAELERDKLSSKRDLMGRLDFLRKSEREKQLDRERKEDRDFRREMALKKEKRLDMDRFEDKKEDVIGFTPEQRKEFKQSIPVKKADNILSSSKVLGSQIDKVDDLLKQGESTKATELAKTVLKELNSISVGTSDAVGVEEARRLGRELEYDIANIRDYGKLRNPSAFVSKVRDKLDAVKGAAYKMYEEEEELIKSGRLYTPRQSKQTPKPVIREEKKEEKQVDKEVEKDVKKEEFPPRELVIRSRENEPFFHGGKKWMKKRRDDGKLVIVRLQ